MAAKKFCIREASYCANVIDSSFGAIIMVVDIVDYVGTSCGPDDINGQAD
jgi:hypothetical protein